MAKPKSIRQLSKILFSLGGLAVLTLGLAAAIAIVQEPQILESFAGKPAEPEPEICIQVITEAQNPKTGECREFPTPCDVPKDWVKGCPTPTP